MPNELLAVLILKNRQNPKAHPKQWAFLMCLKGRSKQVEYTNIINEVAYAK